MSTLITFPGQGSQHPKILDEISKFSPILAKKYKDSLNEVGIDIEYILKTSPNLIDQTENTQPLILAFSYLLFEHYESKLKKKSLIFAGHSLGELTAACISASLTLKESLILAQKRALLMIDSLNQHNLSTQTFALLGQYTDQVKQILQKYTQVWAINFNSPEQTVISGKKSEMEFIKKELSLLETTKRIVPLHLSVSSHCPLLENITKPWKNTLEAAFSKKRFLYPIASNVAFEPTLEKEKILKRLTEQLILPVQYYKMIQKQKNIHHIIEIGPKKVLTNLHQRMSINADINSSEDFLSNAQLLEIDQG